MKIPLVDLSAQYKTIKKEVDRVIQCVLNETAFIGGVYVKNFEKEFASASGAKYCVGVGNGTDALFIILKALGLKEGDEVIVPANTFIATAEAVTSAGGKVVFADCDPEDFCIDISDIKRKITKRTKVIIPVHLYGLPARMAEILSLARKNKIFVLEDSAQAHLALYRGKPVGSIGDAGAFSFFPGKNLGAYGDAGAIVTNNEEFAKKCRMLANHGRIEKYNHLVEGYNSRLDGLQAGILSVKLKRLQGWTKKRREVAKKYSALLKDIPEVTPPKIFKERESAFHLFVIRAKQRDALRDFLKGKGVEVGIHYPIGLPYLEAYGYLKKNTPKDFPETFRAQNEILSLPIYPELTTKQIKFITDSIKKFYVQK